MASIDVKKQQSSEKEGRGLQQRESGRELTRRRDWEPFFSLSPSEFFSTNPFSLVRRFHEEVDRTFGKFFGQETGGTSGTWYPAIEVAEREGRLEVRAELPGLKPEDVTVEVTDDALILHGERKEEDEENKGGVYRSERRYGTFYREIPLPEGAKAEEAKAQFRDGILEVRMPVPEQKSSRRPIPIEQGTASEQKK